MKDERIEILEELLAMVKKWLNAGKIYQAEGTVESYKNVRQSYQNIADVVEKLDELEKRNEH